MKLKLWQQVLVGLFLGVAAGYALGEKAAGLKVLGVIFIDLIKAIMVPLVFFALINGVTSMGQQGNMKRVGFKSVAAYMTTAMFAVCLGLIFANIFKPGADLNMNAHAHAHAVPASSPPGLMDTLLSIVPSNIMGAMANANILQVVIFAIFTGIMMNSMRDRCATVIRFSQEAAQLTFKMIETIVRLAPIGVFGFIAATVGTQGSDVLLSLARLVEAVLVACIVQYLLFGVMIALFARLSPLPFYKKMLPTQMLAFSTSSSKATLSTAMREMQEKMGVSHSGANFVMPLGAAINMDGTAIYLGMCAVFFSQAYGIDLQMADYFMILLTATLGSIGAAGIPSGSLIFMGMVLSSVGLPLEGIALIAGIDRILDMIRTTINITGDCAITLMIDKSEKQLDEKVYYSKPEDVKPPFSSGRIAA
jgi:Na+/H+-dicarboxylate symporter